MVKRFFSQKGLTIIEVLVSIGILTFVSVSMTALANRTMQAGVSASDRTKAIGLAQQALEAARSVRDGNWLHGDAWSKGLDHTEADLKIIYKTIDPAITNFPTNADGFVDATKIIDNGTYLISLRFYPVKVGGTVPDNEMLKAEATISWQAAGTSTEKSESYITDWRGSK